MYGAVRLHAKWLGVLYICMIQVYIIGMRDKECERGNSQEIE